MSSFESRRPTVCLFCLIEGVSDDAPSYFLYRQEKWEGKDGRESGVTGRISVVKNPDTGKTERRGEMADFLKSLQLVY